MDLVVHAQRCHVPAVPERLEVDRAIIFPNLEFHKLDIVLCQVVPGSMADRTTIQEESIPFHKSDTLALIRYSPKV